MISRDGMRASTALGINLAIRRKRVVMSASEPRFSPTIEACAPKTLASGKLMGDLDLPTVNPLDLPYFMAATFVMSFGLIFLVIATTWLK